MKAKLDLENELRDVVSRLISQVSIASKQTRTDINLTSEDAWIPILREVFQASKLENLNRHKKNFPGIDLGDTENRICFQVTATTDIEKVKDALTTFMEKKYHNTFDDLYIFILQKRQKTYSQTSIDKIIGDKNFAFFTDEHIIDPEDIVEKITQLRFPNQQRLLRELKAVAGDIDAKISSLEQENDVPYVFATNLLPITYPNTIYSADVRLDNDAIWEAAKEFVSRMPRKKTTRSCLYLSLEIAGFKDIPFVLHENKIFTFIDLESSSPFDGLIDSGSIEPFESSELFDSEFVEYENVFKQLLKSSIQVLLKNDEVAYSRKDQLFYFLGKGEEDRKISWKDKKQSTRSVCSPVMDAKDKSSIYGYRHFAFDLSFSKIEGKWFAVIYPSWHFTKKNGYKHPRNMKLVTDKKKLELNHSVRNHVRFIAAYLNTQSSEQESDVGFSSLIEFTFNHEEIVDLAEQEEELLDEI
ncbi:MAG: SMEK domain-containing protein [Pseudomonadota bacterium]|nr:SMEK domain-containing protein [Pseudomonadota bacterium]